MTGLLFIHEGMIEKLWKIHALPVKNGVQEKNLSVTQYTGREKKKGN